MRPEDLPLDTKALVVLRSLAHRYDIPALFLRNYSREQRHPITKPFRALEREAIELLSATTDDELIALAAAIPEGFRRLEIPTTPIYDRADLLRRLAPTIVEWRLVLLKRDFAEVLALKPSEGEVLSTYPELESSFDDDGLLVLDERFKLVDGAVLYKDHAMYCHQFLRRNFNARPNFDFLACFADYVASAPRGTCRIALDHSRVIQREWYARVLELDAWYGPPWDAKLLDDPDAVGLTVVVTQPGLLVRAVKQAPVHGLPVDLPRRYKDVSDRGGL